MEIREATDHDFPLIFQLYQNTGWINYTNNPPMLEAAVRHSLKVLVACSNGILVGVIRAVGDGASTLCIQDIIVAPEHRRRGIGTALLRAMDRRYPDVYQKILLTDDQPRSLAFYENCGFAESRRFRCVAMVKYNV